MSRRVLTKSSIDKLISEGRSEYQATADDIITPLALDYAKQRDFVIIPAFKPEKSRQELQRNNQPMTRADREQAAATPGGAPTPEPTMEPISDHAAVRKAVIAAVGYEPEGLDAIISRVMR